MTDFPASHRDLLEKQGFATLATISPTGHPQLTEVVYLLDDDGELKISLNTIRHKTRNLQRDPRCSVLFLDLENPLRYLEVRGDVEIADDPGKAFAAKAGARYGLDFTQNDQPGEERVVVTVRPTRVHAVDISR
jgi:PPOX class probable F420-dependent enzyme